jgi:DNA helicase-2/ATP-dependent DNA helicase PcrA
MIDYRQDLNPAQYEAVTTLEGPVLVIAGAGSGKTRTIVYRLVRLVESGIPASSILLLTFTRKAASEMLERARALMPQRGLPDSAPGAGREAQAHGLSAIQGGTFHSFAYSVLRLFQPEGYGRTLTVMDNHDILASLQHCREELQAGKGDRSFPKNQTIGALISKSRNKEASLEDILRREATHLMPHVETIGRIAESYARFKREKGLLDYDDLLFAFEEALLTRPEALAYCRNRYRYIMVDEYQDTNPVQARLAGMVAGLDPAALSRAQAGASAAAGEKSPTPEKNAPEALQGNIMVVGDDAQSIYAFRGADVRNILRFPELFPNARLIRLEENYRSTQPVLDLANAIRDRASEGYAKRLFTRREGNKKPNVVRPLSDRSEAAFVAARIAQLLRAYAAGDIAVLFRAGFHSYALEVELNKMGVPFRKYGGIRYTEAAHVRDALSFIRLVQNPLDYTAFARVAELGKGVGEKTCLKIYRIAASGDGKALGKAVERFPDLAADLAFLDQARQLRQRPAALLGDVVEHYHDRLTTLYPDDYPRRLQELEQLIQVASSYAELDMFVADLSLEDPKVEEEKRDNVVLSTVHSAKGLEWPAVILINLVEERFPSRHSMTRPDEYEEERRLMYVACTRAKEILDLYVPATMYDRGSGGSIPAVPSPFVRELAPELYVELQESYTGTLVEKRPRQKAALRAQGDPLGGGEQKTDRGRHRPGLEPGAGGVADPFLSQAGADSESAFAAHGPSPTESPPPPLTEDDPPALGQGQSPALPPSACGFCRHRLFGRGKIVQYLPPDKYRVNFPGIGLKVIMAAYLSMEE